MKRIEKPKLRIKVTQEVFEALAKGHTYEFDREWLPYGIVLENWGELMIDDEIKYLGDEDEEWLLLQVSLIKY